MNTPAAVSGIATIVAVWFVLTAVTACGTAAAFWLATTGRRPFRGWSMFVRGCLAAVALVAIIDAVLRAFALSASPSGRLAVGVVAALAAAAFLRMPVPTAGRGAWLSVGMLAVACGISTALFTLFSAPDVWQLGESRLAHVVPENEQTGAHAVTDRGSVIPLGHFESDSVGPDAPAPPDVPEGFSGQVIVANNDPSTANCHGFVFTDGRFHVASELVDRILGDNGYHVVTTPEPHDVIVYRDDTGVVLHTGIVKSVGDDGFVLVESKWGPLHTYWHTPEAQSYSHRFDYWRSPRDGHLLTIVAPEHDESESAAVR